MRPGHGFEKPCYRKNRTTGKAVLQKPTFAGGIILLKIKNKNK